MSVSSLLVSLLALLFLLLGDLRLDDETVGPHHPREGLNIRLRLFLLLLLLNVLANVDLAFSAEAVGVVPDQVPLLLEWGHLCAARKAGGNYAAKIVILYMY